MLYKQYKYKFYLDLNHYVQFDGKNGSIHPHTWEITLDISSSDENITQFSAIEKRVDKLLSRFQDQLINEIPPFDKVNPTLENACSYFLCIIQDDIIKKGWMLLMIEISETPTRSYIINAVDWLAEDSRNSRKAVPPLSQKTAFEASAPKGGDFDYLIPSSYMHFDI